MSRTFLVAAAAVASLAVAACTAPQTSPDQAAIVAEQQRAEEQAAAEAARLAQRQAWRDAIQMVLTADVNANQPGATSAQVATAMRAIDMATCPDDFRAAYLSHIFAWEAVADLDRRIAYMQSDENQASTILASGASWMLNLKATPIADYMRELNALQAKRQDANQAVSTTYQTVLITATQYGASAPN